MNGFRRAALAMSALSKRDRKWMLGRLPADQRRHIEPLLQELDQLGLVPQPEMLEQLRAEDAMRGAEQLCGEDKGLLAAVRALEAAPAPRVEAVLADESAPVVAALLARYRWGWAHEVLSSMTAERRQAVVACMSRTRLMRDRTWRALVLALAGELQALEPVRWGAAPGTDETGASWTSAEPGDWR